MLILPTTPELETRLHAEAAKRGLEATEYAVRLIEGMLGSTEASDAVESQRLSAIDELMGLGINAGFTTADLHRERRHERDREETAFEQLFKGQRPA